jgi:hypothetical protein
MPSKRTPRDTFAVDVSFFHRPKIMELAPDVQAAPLVFLVMLWEAKHAARSGRLPPEKQGTVTVSRSQIARFSRVTEDDVRKVVDSAVHLELLERVPGRRGDRFTVRFVEWEKWEPRDAAATHRVRRHRERRIAREDADWPDLTDQ